MLQIGKDAGVLLPLEDSGQIGRTDLEHGRQRINAEIRVCIVAIHIVCDPQGPAGPQILLHMRKIAAEAQRHRTEGGRQLFRCRCIHDLPKGIQL